MAGRVGPLEDLDMNPDFWRGRRVFLTGHTGFKGGWLALWLGHWGAQVFGYALDPEPGALLFAALDLKRDLAADTRADVRSGETLTAAMVLAQPDVVFHLAAQPLVRASYEHPLETFAVNALGTAQVLDAARRVASVRAIVVVTTDKCYEEDVRIDAYLESDRLGGKDPYSASKACAELITASYRASFFGPAPAAGAGSAGTVRVATGRAGNVMGGGDWGAHRLVPDCIRALTQGVPIVLRYPHAVRPWQHVLEPLAGYLRLAELMCEASDERFSQAWNFGPPAASHVSVQAVAAGMVRLWGRGDILLEPQSQPAETGRLALDATKAGQQLDWHPRWDLGQTLEATVAWYRAWREGADMRAFSIAQIASYCQARLP